MTIVQVKDATGSVLDWIVAKAVGFPDEEINTKIGFPYLISGRFNPSVNWEQGGQIIDREIGNLWKHNKLDPNDPDVWTAAAYCKAPDGTLLYYEDGPTPLIAAMRCYVASKLGDTVEVPDELI